MSSSDGPSISWKNRYLFLLRLLNSVSKKNETYMLSEKSGLLSETFHAKVVVNIFGGPVGCVWNWWIWSRDRIPLQWRTSQLELACAEYPGTEIWNRRVAWGCDGDSGLDRIQNFTRLRSLGYFSNFYQLGATFFRCLGGRVYRIRSASVTNPMLAVRSRYRTQARTMECGIAFTTQKNRILWITKTSRIKDIADNAICKESCIAPDPAPICKRCTAGNQDTSILNLERGARHLDRIRGILRALNNKEANYHCKIMAVGKNYLIKCLTYCFCCIRNRRAFWKWHRVI